MATLNYLTRYTKTNQTRIYFRFVNGREYQTIMQTPIFIPPGDWDKKRQKLKVGKLKPNTRDSINTKLVNFKANILNAVTIAKMEGELINTPWLRSQRNELFNITDTSKQYKYLFEHYINRYIDNSKASYNYKKTFTTVLKRLVHFQTYSNHTYQFKELDLKFNTKFIEWAERVEGYSPSVVNKTIKTFKHFIKSAKEEKIKVNSEWESFKGTKTIREGLDIYLNHKDIEEVTNWEAPTPLMQNVKNLFLVGLYTGLRVSDLMRFNNPKAIPPTIKNGNIDIVTIKTKQKCVIPIHKDIKPLLPIIKPIKDTKFNLYIKRIAEGLNWEEPTNGYLFNKDLKRKVLGVYPRHQLVSSHIMRRSYATNRSNEGDSLIQIASATGHTTTTQLENYLKTTKQQHADKKQQQWRDQ